MRTRLRWTGFLALLGDSWMAPLLARAAYIIARADAAFGRPADRPGCRPPGDGSSPVFGDPLASGRFRRTLLSRNADRLNPGRRPVDLVGWRGALPLFLMLITTIGCATLAATPTPAQPLTPTATAQSVFAQTLQASGHVDTPTPSNASGASGSPSSSTPPTSTATPSPTPTTQTPTPTPTTPTPTPTTTPTTRTPPPSGGPYVVKQIETLGGEVISGFACSLTLPFSVSSVTPRVSFVFLFVPRDATHGQVTYSYSIPSAGESHDAIGTYNISPADSDGTLHLSLSVSDHVVFKGFDGNIPLNYKFDLVPSTTVTCP